MLFIWYLLLESIAFLTSTPDSNILEALIGQTVARDNDITGHHHITNRFKWAHTPASHS
jgi:hypothetical protein